MYALILDAWNIAAGEVETLYYGSAGLTTAPDDTPGNAYFAPRLIVPAAFSVEVFRDGVTGGSGDIGLGEIELAAVDGALDFLAGYALDGRRFTLVKTSGRRIDAGAVVMTGVVESVSLGWERVTLDIRDRRAELERPIQETVYAGTNVLPAGIEGTADDIKGKTKPLAYGKCLNIPLACVNTSTLTYQASAGRIQSVTAVYDKGVALTATTDHATSAALMAATFSAGQYATCLAEGLIRLWASPAGDVTADVLGDATGGVYVDTATGIMERILRGRAGYGDADISAADFAALDAAAPQTVGIFIPSGDSTDTVDALDRLARSVGAWWAFDRLGVVRAGRFAAPSGTPVAILSSVEIVDEDAGIERLPSHDAGNGVPAWRVALGWGRNWTRQDANRLAGAVTDARRAWLAETTRTAVAEDETVKVAHLLAPEIEVETLLTEQAEAEAEAARLLALYAVRRDRFRVVTIPKYAAGIGLGSVVRLKSKRFGLSGGKLFVVLGRSDDFEANRTEVDLYG